jgi:uncharacterized protein (TIGR02448 family)
MSPKNLPETVYTEACLMVRHIQELNMNTMRTLSLAALLALSGTVGATSFVVTTEAVVGAIGATSDATSDVSSSSSSSDKIVLAARDDAASFVASQGSIRGVQLEAALQHIRKQTPTLQGDDMQLAKAILSL